MVVLEAWYDVDDDEPISIRAADELDSLLDRMAADGMDFEVPPLAEFSLLDSAGWAIVHVGINPKLDRGFVTHASPSGGSTSSNGTGESRLVEYDYMGHVREVPADAEVPLTDVRRAVHEFLANGERPTCVEWR